MNEGFQLSRDQQVDGPLAGKYAPRTTRPFTAVKRLSLPRPLSLCSRRRDAYPSIRGTAAAATAMTCGI